MIVNGSTPQHMYLLPTAATKAVARAFTPFFLLPELLQIRLAPQADISSKASTRHMSCALDVYHPDESANLPNMFCNCFVHLAFGILMICPSPIQFFQEQATQQNILCKFSSECESTRHSGLQTGLRCLQKQNISDMNNGSGHYTEKASSRSPIFLCTSKIGMGGVLKNSLHSYFHKEAFRCLPHKRIRQLLTMRIHSDSLLAILHCIATGCTATQKIVPTSL